MSDAVGVRYIRYARGVRIWRFPSRPWRSLATVGVCGEVELVEDLMADEIQEYWQCEDSGVGERSTFDGQSVCALFDGVLLYLLWYVRLTCCHVLPPSQAC